MKRGANAMSGNDEHKWLDLSDDCENAYLCQQLPAGDYKCFLETINKNKITALKAPRKLGCESITHLFRILIRASSVTALDLSYSIDSTVGKKGAEVIANALRYTNLTHLNLHGCNIGDDGAKAIASVLPGTNIEDLNLEFTKIGIKGILAILKVLPSTKVTKLNLSCNNINSKHMLEIQRILPKTLTTLDLSGNNLGNNGAKAIAKKLRGDDILEELNLSSNGIGKEGAQAIAAMFRGTEKLKVLDFANNYLKSEDILDITKVLPSTGLSTLRFYSSRKIEKGFKNDASGKDHRNVLTMAEMLHDTRVTTFDLKHNHIRENTINEVNKALEFNKQRAKA